MPERINRIKELLVIQNFSQKELAERFGKNPNTIASFCNNKIQPNIKLFRNIAKILNVDLRDLFVPTNTT